MKCVKMTKIPCAHFFYGDIPTERTRGDTQNNFQFVGTSH